MSASNFCNRRKDGEITKNDVSIPLSSTGDAAGFIDVAIDDPVHSESVETVNSSDAVTNCNPISGASPLEFSPTAILDNDTALLQCSGKQWKSQFSKGFCPFSRIPSTTGSVLLGVDWHSVSSASAAEFFSKAMLGHDTALLYTGKLGKSPISDGFCLPSWISSTAGRLGIDFHPNSVTLAAEFVHTAMLGIDINRL